MNLKDLNINQDWTLFLDRDGVINVHIVNEYVTKWEEFSFLPGVLDSLKILSEKFGRIIIISNQQGISKGIFTDKDLEKVHSKMLDEISRAGGRIDKIYYCPDMHNTGSKNRKPEIGMALQAKNDFPEIDFEKSIMIGDSASDIIFGNRLNMKTVFLCNYFNRECSEAADFTFLSLGEFVGELK
ncbi:MAG: HAD family hydrolase [Saprospiraceae bacterium]|nr:HAD family hydrolase [Saprospiraceae bacterium]